MKKRYFFRSTIIIVLVVCLIMPFTMISIAKTKKITTNVYSQLYKKGNIVYCNDGYNIFKVNLNTAVVKKMTKTNPLSIEFIKIKKGYVYFNEWRKDDRLNISRVNVMGGSKKILAITSEIKFAVRDSIIYYHRTHNSYNKMKLNGKSKKKTKAFYIKQKELKANVKGYRITKVKSDDFDARLELGTITYYLVTASGNKIKLIEYEASEIC